MTILSHFQAIIDWHREHQTPVVAQLRPGLKPDKIEKRAKQLPFALPPEIKALYELHDGLKDNAPLFTSFTFLPLGEVVAEYELACEMAEDFEPPDDAETQDPEAYWKPSWLPLFGFQGDYYLIDAALGLRSPVYYRVGTEPALPWYDNLSRMFKTIRSCFEQGAYFYDEDQILAEDFEKANSLREQLNPRSAKLGSSEPEPIKQELDEQPDGTRRLTTWFSEDHYIEQFYGPDQRKIGQSEYYQGDLTRRDSYLYIGADEVEITSENLMGFMMTTKTRGRITADGSVETTHVQTFMQDQMLFEQDLTKDDEDEDWDEEDSDDEDAPAALPKP
ncbi:MAG: hypothetical protein CVV27_20870 [Candidatus Melainabacteria bacterium HGW-Melainabacteria-1]|nr:MAG: hypothetical protein CVV27_20870 [Candidatus Melainabacteria bacterium HGW-Melainabacteria-1]